MEVMNEVKFRVYLKTKDGKYITCKQEIIPFNDPSQNFVSEIRNTFSFTEFPETIFELCLNENTHHFFLDIAHPEGTIRGLIIVFSVKSVTIDENNQVAIKKKTDILKLAHTSSKKGAMFNMFTFGEGSPLYVEMADSLKPLLK